LIVVDLSNPDAKQLKVLGELEIPGFSDYMHPLDDNHLLTIGRDNGLMLQIFDVADPSALVLAHKYEYSPEGWSEANDNHKAFTYYAAKKLLAFPFVNYGYPTFQSSLEIFRVSTDTGFKKLGSISHTDLLMAGCPVEYLNEGWFDYYACGRPQPEVRRGLFISEENADYVYSISYGGVKVHDIADLTGDALGTVTLPAVDETYWGDGSVPIGGIGGFINIAGAGGIMTMIPGTGGAAVEPIGGIGGIDFAGTGGVVDPIGGIGGIDFAGTGGVDGTTGGAGGVGGSVAGAGSAGTSGSGSTSACGDGIIDPDEECDSDNLGGATCESLTGATGVLLCSIACLYDLSACGD